MTLKPITVRLPEDDLERARQDAEVLGMNVDVYLRMLFRQNLRRIPDPLEVRERRAEALRKFSEVFSAELEEQGVTEEDAVRLAREARKRFAERKRKEV